MKKIIWLLIFMGVCAGVAHATTTSYVTIQSSQCTYGVSSHVGTNYNTDANIYPAYYSSSVNYTCWVAFDTSSIPSNATIVSSTITFYQTDGLGTDTVSVFRVLRNWIASQVTWNSWKTSNSWTTAGGRSSGNDRAASSSLDYSFDNSVGAHNMCSASIATDVQNWVNGTNADYGWAFYVTSTLVTNNYHTCDSDASTTQSQRPKLTVRYTTPDAVTTIGTGSSAVIIESEE
jgi:hypothetical protein